MVARPEHAQGLLAVAIDHRKPFGRDSIVHVRVFAMPAPDSFQVGCCVIDAVGNQKTDRVLAGT